MAFTGIANAQLIETLKETRARTLELVNDLSDKQLIGPRLQIVNPLQWEIGHLAWFQEFWVLRHLGGQLPILRQGDELYDSARVAHDTRWDLPLLGREETLSYMGWGDDSPTWKDANLDWRALGCVPVDALPAGDSAFGCRQMIGNVWEWTASDFQPYPGFVAGPYREYSEPWFGNHKVLRGGCWATRSRLIHNSYRNFYTPDRRDVWAGFRTCARLT
jgi:EgtB-related family protein